MSKEFLEKELFLPFHTTKSDGLGIGLFHCKRIIEAHWGDISIRSEENRGTVVRIRFPVVDNAVAINSNFQDLQLI
jgi:signal transduction histidine kinase